MSVGINRPKKGFVFVDPEGSDINTGPEYWIELTLESSPRAKG